MTRDLRPRRLLLSAGELAHVRGDLPLPPGWPAGEPDAGSLAARGPTGPAGRPHPALVADLARLAQPELAVLVEAACPVGDVQAAVALHGPLGTALRRVPGGAELSAFAATGLAVELSRLVPGAPSTVARCEVALSALLAAAPSGVAAELRARQAGTLRATVVRGGSAGVVDWVWLRGADGGGWAALEPLGGGRVRVEPVGPAQLPLQLAPYAGLLLAGAS